jgi:site-specific recombinase XerD
LLGAAEEAPLAKRSSTKLTKRLVDSLSAGEAKWDSEVRGFGVRCQNRDRVYVLKTFIGGRQRFVTIGKHGSPWTVETARKRAQTLLAELRFGGDPVAAKRALKNKPTIAQLSERYLEEHARPHKPRSAWLDESNIRNHILPLLGDMFVDQVKRADIEQFQNDVSNGKTAPQNPRQKQLEQKGGSAVRGGQGVSNRCLALLSKMFNLAEAWELRQPNTNPVLRVKRYEERKRERFLNADEFQRLGAVLHGAEKNGDISPWAIGAIRLLIFTGARLGEILNLRWSDVNFDRRIIRLPESKTGPKNIHLSKPALETLRSIPHVRGNSLVIAGKVPNRPMVGLKKIWRKIRSDADLTDLRIHDLRHSFASVAVGEGVSLPLIGGLLGHNRSATTERYAHLAGDVLTTTNDNISARIEELLYPDRDRAKPAALDRPKRSRSLSRRVPSKISS